MYLLLNARTHEDFFFQYLGWLRTHNRMDAPDFITRFSLGPRQDLGTMVKNMKEYFDEEIDEKRQEFEAHLEVVKVPHHLHKILAGLA